MTKRSPTEVWKALSGKDEEDATDADMEAVLAMKPEDRRNELERAGFDLERFHAEADARDRRPPEVAPRRPRRIRRIFMGAAAALVTAGASVAGVVQVLTPAKVIVGGARDDKAAAKLRRQAHEACAKHDFETCLADLDKAKAIDPEGDEAPEVQALRQSATDRIKAP